MGVRLFGVADPAGTGRCENRLLGCVGYVTVDRVVLSGSLIGRGLEDFFSAHHKTGFAHGICVHNPCKAISMLASRSKAVGSA